MELVKALFVGEGMIELSRAERDLWQLRIGGDTLNSAIHLARAGFAISYLTAVGHDPFSRLFMDMVREEGVGTGLILTHPSRSIGLYAIDVDGQGERSFSYWRQNSAAREMFALLTDDAAREVAAGIDLLGFSLITLAILPPEGRTGLLQLCEMVRERGGKVLFDGNYRPKLWEDAGEAIAARDAAIAFADFGLPTLEDEAMLDPGADAESVAAHWSGLGCGEVIVKLGAQGCLLPDGQLCAPPVPLLPVDTSGAGDAFNAGYIAARMRGGSPRHAALAGHALAGWTIMRPGAIPPVDPA